VGCLGVDCGVRGRNAYDALGGGPVSAGNVGRDWFCLGSRLPVGSRCVVRVRVRAAGWFILLLDLGWFVAYGLAGGPFVYGLALSAFTGAGLMLLFGTVWALWVFVSTMEGRKIR
jgi:hypothetical protein